MGAFHAMANGDDLQDLTYLNQIINAYSERRQALGQSAIAALPANTDIQLSDWYGWFNIMQYWCENNYDDFVNHDAIIVGQGSVSMFTLTTWRSEADIAYGFRRVQGATWPADWTNYSDPAFTYGLYQQGDIFGPWLFVDLQNALKALKKTYVRLSAETSGSCYLRSWGYCVGNGDTQEEAIENNASTWSFTTDEACSDTEYRWYEAHTSTYETDSGWHAWSYRYYYKPQLAGVATFRPCGADVYGFMDSHTFDFDTYPYDGGLLWLVGTIVANSDSTKQCGNYFLPGSGTNPMSLTTDDNNARGGLFTYWVMSWSFTYDS